MHQTPGQFCPPENETHLGAVAVGDDELVLDRQGSHRPARHPHVGALALGAALGTMAIIARHELVLVIMGGVFVMETLSVILQVGSFKLTGKRIFKMAPIHHHFELMGWPEPRVIVRFWIITVMLVLFGLATLKLR